VSVQKLHRVVAIGLLALATCAGFAPSALGQDEVARKARVKVTPVYPELARKMNVAGTVKVQVVIGANGVVKSTKLVGGHPLLAESAMEAVKKWKFEPGDETTQVVAFNFTPNQ
jgi:TonB family protein